jgi:hypothetical protein
MTQAPNASIATQRLFIWMAIIGAMLFAVAWIGLMRFFPPPPPNAVPSPSCAPMPPKWPPRPPAR